MYVPNWSLIRAYTENYVTIATYTYDGSGLRTSKTVGNNTTSFINDGAYVVGEVSGDSIIKYTYGTDLISINNNGTLGYYHTDEHGNVSAISNVSRTVVADYDFDAFGNETVSTDTYYNPMRYCGEYYDAETDLIYLRARYYDSSIGRFISEDPHWDINNMIYGDKEYEEDEVKVPDAQAISQASNLYVYGLNNPVKYIDITGEDAWGIGIGGYAAAGLRVDMQVYLVFDDAGNSGILLVGGVGGGTVNAGFSVTGFYNGTADTIYDLEGQGSSVGGSIGPVGVDMSAEMDSIAVSWGGSAIPLEVHAVVTGGVLIQIF